jgi:hypothetical protein
MLRAWPVKLAAELNIAGNRGFWRGLDGVLCSMRAAVIGPRLILF